MLEEEDRKRLLRERRRLVKERTSLTNSIKGLLKLHGIFDLDPRLKGFDEKFADVETAYGSPFPPRARQEIDRLKERLSLVERQIAEVEAERDAAVRTGADVSIADVPEGSEEQAAAKIATLTQLKGIGENDATVLVHEIFYRGFRNRRELASWVGLTPTPWGAVPGSPEWVRAASHRSGASHANLGNPPPRLHPPVAAVPHPRQPAQIRLDPAALPPALGRHPRRRRARGRARALPRTLRTIAADPRHGGMRIGGTAVLHTWDQKLRFHPHVHVVVPNAGFDVESGEWKTGSGAWLAPVKVLSSFFRRRFLEDLARAHGRGELGFHGTAAHLANPGEFHATLAAARSRDWVVYAKRPFKGPEQVFSYLARYTHRIAISDSRITAFDGERVSFRHRKPKTPGQRKPRYGTITVSAEEFIRRFLLHVLPDGMHRIRYFGILANGCRARTLERARETLGSVGCATPGKTAEGLEAGHDRDREREPEVTTAPVACSHCGGVLRLIREIPRRQEPLSTRGPPDVPPPRGAGP